MLLIWLALRRPGRAAHQGPTASLVAAGDLNLTDLSDCKNQENPGIRRLDPFSAIASHFPLHEI